MVIFRGALSQPAGVDRFNYRDAARYEVRWYRRTVLVEPNEHWKGEANDPDHSGVVDFITAC